MRKPWVGFEGDHLRVDYGFEFLCRHVAELQWDHDVHLTVALQDRDVLVAVGRLQSRDIHAWTTSPHWSVNTIPLTGFR